jgi:hypothetical protein
VWGGHFELWGPGLLKLLGLLGAGAWTGIVCVWGVQMLEVTFVRKWGCGGQGGHAAGVSIQGLLSVTMGTSWACWGET